MSRDAYISIRGGRSRVWNEPLGDAIVMVDLERKEDLEALRNVDPGVTTQRNAPMLIRTRLPENGRDAFIEQAGRLFTRWNLPLAVSLLEQPVGEEPTLTPIRGDEMNAEERGRALQHARAAELHALLDWGKAIWRPRRYHYLLPSGEHAGEYIRIADALREPRDAVVLASWLHQRLVDHMGIVIDTGALNPVAFALMQAMEQSGLTPNPVAVLDQYPRTSADLDAAIDLAAGIQGNVLALLSISSSGAVLGRLNTALKLKVATLSKAVLEVLIRKSSVDISESAEVWSPLPGAQPLVSEGTIDTTCELCRSPDRAPICPISPRTLDEMLPAQLKQVMPSVTTALRNRRYWEVADGKEAVCVEAHPHPALDFYRPSESSMPIAVRPEQLLGASEFREECASRCAGVKERNGLGSDPDLVLAPEHECGFDGYGEFWKELKSVIAPRCEMPIGYPIGDQNFSEELKEQVREASSVLVFCLGSVTGVSLQRGLVGVQSAKGDPDFRIEGLVLHARPATEREWSALTNAYGYDQGGEQKRLFYAWKTLLPDRSPMREELALLEGIEVDDLADDDLRTFHEQRIKLCGGGSGTERPPLFWGSAPEDRLTPNAIFGEKLSPRAAYAAVAAAMEASRTASAEAPSPEYRVFELPAMFRSYYDPLLVCSLLRWLLPHEAWWGWRWSDPEITVSHLINRTPLSERRTLIPELLLAAAQGKIGPSAIPSLRSFAEDQLGATAPASSSPMRLGLHLCPE